MPKKYHVSKHPHLGSQAHKELEMVVLDISDDRNTPATGQDEKDAIEDITEFITNFLERAIRSVNEDQRVRISRAGRTSC